MAAMTEREVSTMPAPKGMRWEAKGGGRLVLWADGELWCVGFTNLAPVGLSASGQPWTWGAQLPGRLAGGWRRRGFANTRELACTAIMAALDDMLESA